jgi:pilus assembly protein CpaE
MSAEQAVVGILSPSVGFRESLRSQLIAVRFQSATVEADQYCTDRSDRVVRKLFEARPQIILVDMQDPQAALQTLKVLHEVLPEAWLFASSTTDNSQLIIETMRSGAREFLPKPVTAASLSQALARYTTETEKILQNKARGKVYCVTSAKGGAGTTSVAINLAVSLASAKNTKVSLLDLGGPVGDAAEYLNLKPTFNVSDVIASIDRLDPVLLESYMSRTHSVAVLPGFKDPHPGLPHPNAMSKLLHIASETYSHSFVDMLCTYDQDQLEVVTECSDAVLVVLTPELPALWRTARLINIFQKSGGIDKLRLVINRTSKKHEISDREIEKSLNHSIFWRLPNNYRAAIQSINSGSPLVSVNHSALAAGYFELTRTLTGATFHKKNKRLFGIFS